MVAVGETVILLHPPLPLLGGSIRTERGCQRNGRTLAGGCWDPAREHQPERARDLRARTAVLVSAAGGGPPPTTTAAAAAADLHQGLVHRALRRVVAGDAAEVVAVPLVDAPVAVAQPLQRGQRVLGDGLQGTHSEVTSAI